MTNKERKEEIDKVIEVIPEGAKKAGVNTLVIDEDNYKAIKRSVKDNQYKGLYIEVRNDLPRNQFYIR